MSITALKSVSVSLQMIVTEVYTCIAKKKGMNDTFLSTGAFPNLYNITFSEVKATYLISSPLTSNEDVNEVCPATLHIATAQNATSVQR